jgi:hypothetical protein
MVHACNPNYSEGGGTRITVQDQLDKSTRPYLKNKVKAKGLGTWLKWWSTHLANVRL